MTVRFKTGNSATITLGGTLTTGVSTAWVGHIVSINPGEWTLGERDVSTLLDTGFLRVDPHDLAVTNEVSGVARFSAAVGVPSIGSGVDTLTITLPQASTATSGVTRGNIAGKAFFSRVAFPQLANNETMDSEFTLKMTGESLAFTKET
jgi:hypothetical protein|nr:MAG TPA: hypothetical protein [Caudoviricetes sp.]